MKKIKIIHKSLILTFILVTLLFSCHDAFMEHPKSIISPDAFYKNPAQIEGVLAKSFSRTGYFFNFWNPWFTFQHSDELSGGNLVIPPDHGVDVWNRQFNTIMNMNYVIYAIQKGQVEEGSKSEINNLLGMAKFIRGWAYFCLVRFWGPVPILTEKDVEGNYFSLKPARSSIEDVYNLITSDFQTGIDLMKDNPGQSSKPSKGVAKAYLAKAYLTIATYPINNSTYYDKAAKIAWEIIQSGDYSLVEDIDKVFSYETEEGPEMMLSFHANDACWMDFPQYLSAMRGGWSSFVADLRWVERYPEQPRKNAYLDLYNENGEYYADISKNPGLRKYFYGADWERGWADSHIPLIRYADVLLIFAEAANMANGAPTENAVWAINQIIQRANGYKENPKHPLTTIDMSKESFDEKVIQEREWELCFEPHWGRWSDLIRKRLLKEKIREEYLPNFNEEDYLFPIPETDLRLNDNLDQNPGYPNPYKNQK